MVEFRTLANKKGRTQPRHYGKSNKEKYDHEDNYKEQSEVLGEIALWEGKRGQVVWQGHIKFKEGWKPNVSLFHPNSDRSSALYSGNLSENRGAGWETVAYVDFYKSKSDKVKAIGFIKFKGEQQAEYRILLFKNENPKGLENAPKFKGIVILNEQEEGTVINTNRKPSNNYSSDAF